MKVNAGRARRSSYSLTFSADPRRDPDDGTGIAVDKTNRRTNAYVVGNSTSQSFPGRRSAALERRRPARSS
jgi:hypothetical protein